MKLKEIIMTKLFSGLVEVGLEETILVFVVQKRTSVFFPAFFEFFGLANVDSVGVSVDDFVNARSQGMFIVEKPHTHNYVKGELYYPTKREQSRRSGIFIMVPTGTCNDQPMSDAAAISHQSFPSP
jgi:hypothetical protein